MDEDPSKLERLIAKPGIKGLIEIYATAGSPLRTLLEQRQLAETMRIWKEYEVIVGTFNRPDRSPQM